MRSGGRIEGRVSGYNGGVQCVGVLPVVLVAFQAGSLHPNWIWDSVMRRGRVLRVMCLGSERVGWSMGRLPTGILLTGVALVVQGTSAEVGVECRVTQDGGLPVVLVVGIASGQAGAFTRVGGWEQEIESLSLFKNL